MRKLFSLIAAVLFAGSMMAETFTKTAYADLQTGDLVIITEQKGDDVFAASNDQGTSKGPVATAVTVSNDAITTDATNILWTVVKDGDNISFKIGNDYLYCTNSNNGVRVGSNSNNVFSIKDAYLYNNATSRYLGVYNSADFRCYTSVNANIKDQTLAFYAIAGAGEQPGDTVPVVPEDTTVVPLADPTNCAEAAEAAMSVSGNNVLYNGGKEYTIAGYVTSIAYAWKSGNMSFWMADAADGGNVLEAYKCAIANEADAVLVGDKVAVTGQLTKYNTTPEFAQGCTVQILERAQQDTTVTPVDTTVVPIDTTVVPVEGGTEVIFTNADFAGQGTANTGSEVTATKDGVTFTCSKGYSADESLRCYAKGSLSITASSTISKINFTTTGGKTGGLDAEVAVNATSYEVASLASQARFTEIKVTLGEGGEQPGDTTSTDTIPVVPPVVGDTLTCASAAELALAGNTDEYVIKGYVTQYVSEWQEKYKNISFWMADAADGGQVFEAFRVVCETAEEAPAVGDLVWVKGNLAKYNTTPETAAGGSFGILAKAEVVPGDTTSTDTIPVVPPVVGDTLTCASAAELALAGNTDEYVIKGYVTQYVAEWQEKYKNISFWMADAADGGQVFEAFRVVCETAEEAPVVGDLVWVKGNLAKYNTTPETAAGGSFGILAKAEVVPGDTTSTDTIPVVPPVVSDTLTCASARELALGGNTDEYVIKGYVTMYVAEWQEKYKNISFWMADAVDGGQVFEAFRVVCETAEEAPAVGDLVWVKGNLAKYNTTPETSAGGSFGIIEKSTIPVVDPVNLGEKSIAEFLELKNFKDTCVLTGVVSNIKTNSDGSYNKYGNFDITDATGSVYVYGLLTPDGQAQKFQEMGIDEGDTLKIKAVYFDYNGTPQAKNAVFVSVAKAEGNIPVGGDTIEINMSGSEVTYTDAVADAGWWQIEAENDDYYVTLSNGNSIAQAVGAYDVQDLDPGYSYILSATDSISFVSGSITLSEVDSTIVVAGQLVGSDGNTYVLNLVYGATGEQGEYTYKYEPTTVTTVNIVADTISISDYTADYGVVYITLADANGNWASLEFIANSYVGSLPAGTYQINASEAVGTFFASPGGDDENDYGCYVGVIDGEYYNPYYMISGTVTIAADGGITVNATSYNGSTIIVTYTPQTVPTGISDTAVEGKAVKKINNGMLVIEKAGVKYSVLGQKIR